MVSFKAQRFTFLLLPWVFCLENPRMAEPGRLPSMGSHRVGHNWSDLAAAAAAARSSLLCGLSVVSVLGLLIWWLLSKRGTGSGRMVSVVAACGLGSSGSKASVVGAKGLSCSEACRIFPDQGLNLWPLHWQVDSYPLYHQGSPGFTFW